METEIWPNLINQATKFKLPLLLINARISDNAFASYQTLDFFFKPILAKFNTICTQSEIDSQRFISLGAPVDKIHVLGNIKFDLNLVKTSNVNCTNLKMLWGEKRTVLMAASTHDDEEKQLLLNLPKLKRVIPDLILLIAPRHPERFQVVYELSQSSGFKTAKKTAIETINSNIEVLILDSIGELVHFYQLSDYAFVGGSLVPIGGHNVLEPIALKIPVFCGPFMQNSKTICDDLSKAGAISKVRDSDDLVNAIIFLHQNPVQKILQVTNATKVLEANRGSLARYLEIIASIINN
jgi:3-deoxy-D-manno-octulosonic-acid transferase